MKNLTYISTKTKFVGLTHKRASSLLINSYSRSPRYSRSPKVSKSSEIKKLSLRRPDVTKWSFRKFFRKHRF